ncbi:MAG: YfiR family protein [Niastella sp.]|uniref:YfiR family protein n=1 Tax=Niastella sp. TaxID=1869183 RepID=UPI00389AB493
MKKSIEIWKLFCLAGILLLSIGKVQAQHATDYTIHATLIYRFTKYIDWPANKKSGDFIIGIIGDSPLYDDLKSFIANKTVGSQKIVVTKVTTPKNYSNCQILFISEEESGNLKKIAELTSGTPVLLITEYNGLAHKGSCFNFITVNDRLKLEINKSNVEQRNLHIASELLDLAIIIK